MQQRLLQSCITETVLEMKKCCDVVQKRASINMDVARH
jgi:hypothetical protein